MPSTAAHVLTAADRPTPMGRASRLRLTTGWSPRALAALVGASILVMAPHASAAQAPVGLGTAQSFAVLAGSGITNTGPTTITGDIGTFPTTTRSGLGSVTLTGTDHGGDAVTQGAKDDLVVAYDDAAGRIPATPVPVELGGTTLLAGVYTSPTFGLTGTLTLDAQGRTDAQFVFQAGSTLITETNSRVLLLNGADPCRVVWQVGSSATFKTETSFVGDVLAYTSITAQTRATFQGRLLARNGAVTLDTNTITRSSCALPGGTTSTTTIATTPTTTGTTATTATTIGTIGTTGTTPAGTTGTTPAGTTGTTPAGTTGTTPAGTTGSNSPAPRPIAPLLSRSATATPPAASKAPSLALTGVHILGMLATGLLLVAVGAHTLVAGQRGRRTRSSSR
ncbi:MAG TPA: ice-binding family protein [Acidimicrobiales bacterium]|nr:ice-binding family protein [Acidimicrobiales bacterium]